jgi:hypothetical protein
MSGDVDEPDGIAFTDEKGRPLRPCGRPAPPGAPLATAARRLGIARRDYAHPTGERLDAHWLHFNEPLPSA